MAITGKFEADFASFETAVQQAEAHLTDLAAGADRVGGRLNAMQDSFSGKAIIQQATLMAEAVDRVGGVSNLTEKELARVGATAQEAAAKLTAMGTDVPPKIQAIADAARAIHPATAEAGTGALELRDALLLAFDHPIYAVRDLSKAIGVDLTQMIGAGAVEVGIAGAALVGALALIGKEAYTLTMNAAAVGEGIYDASLKMSASVPSVSQLKFAVDAAGGSLEQLAALAFVMQQRMQQNPKQFEEGLAALHVNAKDFIGLDVDQRVLAISTAMRAAGENTNLQATAMELFGRQGRDGLALLMKPLDDLIQQGKDLGFTWTEVDAKAADELAITTRVLDAEWNKLKTDVGVELLPVMQALADHVHELVTDFTKGADGGLLFDVVMLGLKENLRAANAALDLMLGRTADVPKVTGEAAKGVAAWRQSVADLAIQIHKPGDAASVTGAEAMAAEATKGLERAYAELVKQQKLVAEETKKWDELLVHMDKETFALAQEHQKQWSKEQIARTTLQNDAIVSEFDAQVKLNAEWGLNAAGAIAVQKSALDLLNLALDALHLKKAEALAQGVVIVSQAREEQLLTDAYTAALTRESLAEDAAIQKLVSRATETAHALESDRAAAVGAEQAFLGYKNAITLTATSLDDLNAKLHAFYDQLAAGGPIGIAGTGTGGLGSVAGPSNQGQRVVATRDSGGPVTAGQSYLIGGGKAPELFTPGASGFVTPGGGGSTTNVTIYVNGTAADVARQVAAEILRTVKQGAQL